MREILFRGKSANLGWRYGSLIQKHSPHYVENVFWCSLIHDGALTAVEVDPETVGQFSGLYDATKWNQLTEDERVDFILSLPENERPEAVNKWKGKRIFEGDLVKNESGRICVVVWHTISGQWDYNVFSNHEGTNAKNFCNQETHLLEIVGNIHDIK